MHKVAGLALACLSIAACDVVPMEREEFARTVPLARDGSFRLENTNGRVDLVAWDRAEVEIHAIKKAAHPQDVEIQVTSTPQELRVRTVVPRERDWTFSRRSNVDYTVHLPASARVEVEETNGAIDVRDPAGRVTLATINGAITVLGARADVRATATNGAVKVACAHVEPDGIYELETTNGKVELSVPPDVTGHFDGRTVNGWIETTLPLTVSGKLLNHRLHGQIGEGGASFRLSTVNGLVLVQKAH